MRYDKPQISYNSKAGVNYSVKVKIVEFIVFGVVVGFVAVLFVAALII